MSILKISLCLTKAVPNKGLIEKLKANACDEN
jgi:hypothetical protein